jgi:hypothetical protein
LTHSLLNNLLNFFIAVRDALCDEDEEVRDAAARAFNRLQRMVGRVALDSIVRRKQHIL